MIFGVFRVTSLFLRSAFYLVDGTDNMDSTKEENPRTQERGTKDPTQERSFFFQVVEVYASPVVFRTVSLLLQSNR